LTGAVQDLAADLEPFRAYLATQRRLVQGDLAGALRGERFAVLLRGFRDLLERRESIAARPPAASLPVADLARERIVRAFDTVRRRGRRIGQDTPAEALHNLRKRAKELRYLLEFFGTLYDPAGYRNALRELKALQDNLGTFQDTEVQREAVREYATDMHAGGVAGARTLLAMGELAAGLRGQQALARAEFGQRFARFDECAHVVELVSAGAP
jgi:CHAD domain-containing protein